MDSPTPSGRWVPLKADVLDALAAEILQHYSAGKAVVAIDGVDGAGKSRFADALADAIRRAGHEVFVASIDGFHRPRAERYAQGPDSAAGFYEDSYDYDALDSKLVTPFRAGEPFATEVFDHQTDSVVESRQSASSPHSILIVEGIFLHRPELRGQWNYSIWLEVSDAERERRLVDRDGDRSIAARYTEGQAMYLRRANPRAAATAIYDNADVDHPRRVFADAC
jgi:uridine kinase